MPELLANWIGALACAVHDLRTQANARVGDTDAAAVLTCSYFPGTTVGELGEVLALTGSGAVRLVDRLERADLVARQARRGHTVTLGLTGRGRRAAESLQAHRLDAIESLLSALSAAEQDQLAVLVAKVLRQADLNREEARRTCRYCDHRRCDGEACPVGQTLRDKGWPAPRAARSGEDQ